MRIIGGSHRGRRLKPLPGGRDNRAIRPTADRTREALFNILGQGLGPGEEWRDAAAAQAGAKERIVSPPDASPGSDASSPDASPGSDASSPGAFPGASSVSAVVAGSLLAPDSVMLDVFCGTAAVALEALSRGVGRAVALDIDPAALAVARANGALLKEEARCALLRADATRPPSPPALLWSSAGSPSDRQPAAPIHESRRGGADWAFLDPPYGRALGPPALAGLAAAGWLAPGALAVLELAAEETFTPPSGYIKVDERRYGAARLMFLRWLPWGPGSQGL